MGGEPPRLSQSRRNHSLSAKVTSCKTTPVTMMSESTRLLYCNCTYAQVVPKEVKEAVLKKLCESGVAFEAVADLCEMSARQDPALKRLAEGGAVKIAACYPRAVKWLFAAAGAPLPPEGAEVLNMRTQTADDVAAALFRSEVKPNLPIGKTTSADAPATIIASAQSS